MGQLSPLVAVIFTVNYQLLLWVLPVAALLAGLALVVFYSRKTVPELVAIFVGLFLLFGGLSLGVLRYAFDVPVGRVEVIRYMGYGPPD